MGYIGTKPSAVPLTSADITDGIITSAKIADGTIVNADINASAAIDASKLTGLSSDYVLIKTQTASSASSVEFIHGSSSVVFNSTYPFYLLVGYNMYNSTTTGEPEIHITTDSGSTYKTSGYKTVKRRLFESSDSISIDGTGVSTDHIGASFLSLGTDSSYASHFYAYFWNPSNSSARPKVFSQWNPSTSTYTSGYTIMQGVYNTAGSYNGFRIEPNGGTINGTFKLYGIK